MLAIAAFLVAQTQTPDFVQPFPPAPFLAVRAELNGSDTVFGVDTGSFDLIVKPHLASPSARTTQINLGFLSASPIEAKVASIPSTAAGIIGLNYLHEKAIGVDAPDGAASFWNRGNLTTDQVTFWFSHSPDMTSSGKWQATDPVRYAEVNLEDAGDGHFLVDASLNGTPVKFGLDTDAAVSAIDGSAVTDKGFLPLTEAHFGGIGQKWPLHIGIVDSLSFGTENIQSLPVAETPNGSLAPAQGLLGFDFFEDRRVLIDFPAHKLYVGSVASTPVGGEALIAYGIHLAPFAAGRQFIGVVPDSVASRAGLHSGDELLTVDGQPVDPSHLLVTGTTLPFDYSKSGVPKAIKLSVKSSDGKTTAHSLSLPSG